MSYKIVSMTQGTKVELILKDGRIIGYYQYTERNTVYVSMDYSGMTSWGIEKKEIKKIVEL